MKRSKSWTWSNTCWLVLFLFSNLPRASILFEIDRSYLVGKHGYNSLVDYDLLTSNFTMPPNRQNVQFSNIDFRRRVQSNPKKNRQRFFRINTAKRFEPGDDSYANLFSEKTSQYPNPALVVNVNNEINEENKSLNSRYAVVQFVEKGSKKYKDSFGSDIKENDNLFEPDKVQPPGYDSFFYEVPTIPRPPTNENYRHFDEAVVLERNPKLSDFTHKIPENNSKYPTKNSTLKSSNDANLPESGKSLAKEIVFPDAAVSTGRFLSIFEVVNFNNVDCLSSSGLKGTCLHSLECSSQSGTESGDCADRYGICCVFQYTCGDQTSSNCSIFTNPGFPSPSQERLACTLTVYKASPDVTQLMLDIVQMELQPPTNGKCIEDQFVITGQNINSVIPILCGINNNQQMYIEVGDAPGPFYVSVLSSEPAQRLLQVGLCQVSGGAARAPQGCLQFHQGVEGLLESFNYRSSGNLPGLREPGYFNNLNYAICIERAPRSCSITYTNADENGAFEFQISNYDGDGVPILPPGQAGAEIFNCPDDFIVINGIRLCGERLNDASITEDFTLNAPVTELGAGPIVFIFRTNGNVNGRGFRISYKQNPCATPD